MSNAQESNNRISAERLLSYFGHRESLVLLAIIAFGILGSILCFSSALTKTSYSSHNLHLFEDALVNTPKENPMQVQGKKRVGEKLAFEIDHSALDTPLYIDYGDGEIKRVYKTQKVYYNYSFPGDYYLNLFTVENNQKRVISSEKIKIAPNNNQLSILK